MNSTLESIAQLQIDSINVVQRAHYMPLFARLGAYDIGALDRLVARKRGPMTEYWAHEASYVRSELVADLITWQRRGWIDRSDLFTSEHRELTDNVLSYLATHPGTTARELSAALDIQPVGEKQHWGWNWNDTKFVTEALFAQGRILALGRSSQFERRFALAEDVIDLQRAAVPATSGPPFAGWCCGRCAHWAWAPPTASPNTSGCPPPRSPDCCANWPQSG